MQISLVWGLLCKCKHSSGLSEGSQTWEPFDQTLAVFWGNLYWNMVFKMQLSGFAFEIQTSPKILIEAPNPHTSFYGAQLSLIRRAYHLGLCPGCKGMCFIQSFSWNNVTQAVRVKFRTRHFFNSDFSVICFIRGQPGCFCAKRDSHCQTVCFKLFLKTLAFEGS